MHDDISLMQLVIPGRSDFSRRSASDLTRNPVLFRIPAFAGMTRSVVINEVVHKI